MLVYGPYGPEVINVIRKNRKSGGVAIYINKSVNFKSMKCMSMEIDNIMECVSIELCINRGKNCVYITCGSSIAAFSEQIQLLMQKVTNNKTVFLCGDMNVDLLNYGSDTNMTHYVDTMFSLGVYPLIDKPTRITA